MSGDTALGLVAGARRATVRVPARAGVRRGDRVRRPRQRRGQPDCRCALRIPAAVGARRRQCHGRPRPVPVRQARSGHRGVVAGPARHAFATRTAAGLLGAGRARRRRHRHRGGRRRCDRAEPAVRPAVAAGRPDRRRRLAAPAARPEPVRPVAVRDRDRRPARDHRGRVPGRSVRRAAGCARRALRPGAAFRRPRLRAARGLHARRDRDAACDLRALGAGPRPPPCARGPPPPAAGDPLRRRLRARGRRGRQHRVAGPGGVRTAGFGRHRLDPRRLRRPRRRSRASASGSRSPSGCSPPAWPRRP